MRSRRSLKLSHTQTSVPCGTLNDVLPSLPGEGMSLCLSAITVEDLHLHLLLVAPSVSLAQMLKMELESLVLLLSP